MCYKIHFISKVEIVESAGFEPAASYGNSIPSTCLDNF